ncbi:MAG: Ig-like domain-containing protein [Planctomycetales bacterium]
MNAPPVAHTFTLDVTEDQGPQLVTLSGDDGNLEYIQQITYAIESNPAHGTLSDFDATAGTVLYTPDHDYVGPDSFSYTVSDDGATLLSLQGTVSGNIDTPGSVDTYTFSLDHTSTLIFDTLGYVDHLTNNGRLHWTVKGDNGAEYEGSFGYAGPSVDAGWMPNLKPGHYTVTIDGTNPLLGEYFTGGYQFRLVDAATAAPLDPGVPIEGYLTPTNETDLYQFHANAGDRFYFDSLEVGAEISHAQWLLYDPSGNRLWDQMLQSDEYNTGTFYASGTFQFSGTYTLLVVGDDVSGEEEYVYDDEATEYRFGVYPVITPPVTPLALNSPVTGNIATPGAFDLYSFSLAEDSLLYLDAVTADYAVNWELTGPMGTITGSFGDVDFYAIPSPVRSLIPGDYRLKISRSGDSTGAYQFRLSDLSAGTPVTPGIPVTGTLPTGYETDLYRFTATAGDRFYFDLESVSGSIANGRWQLIDPYGHQVSTASRYLVQGDLGTLTMPSTGMYSLLIEGSPSNPGTAGDYAFNVVPVITNPVIPLTLGETISGTIATPGSSETYSFSLGSKSRLYLDSLTPDEGFVWTLKGPSGTVSGDFVTGNWVYAANPVLTLPAGDYELTIAHTGDITGGYQFRLLDLAAALAIGPGTPITGTLNPTNATDIYRLDAIAGNQFQFNSLSYSPYLPTPAWRLIGPQGNVVSTSNYFYNTLGPITIPYTGSYTLLVEGYSGEPGSSGEYSFEVEQLEDVSLPPLTGETLTLNSLTSGSIDEGEEQDQYVFELASETLLYIDNQTANSSIVWTLTGPSGMPATTMYTTDFYPLNPIHLLPAGTYQISLTGSGAYQFNLRTLDSALPFTPGTPVTGTLAPASSASLHRFSAMAGEKYFFDSESISGPIYNARWRLIDPFGNVVPGADAFFNGGDLGTITIPASGEYTLLIEGYPFDGDGSGTFTFNVIPVIESVPVPMTLGEPISGAITSPGQMNSYSFSLASKSKLYFDNLTENSAIHWTLTGPSGTLNGSFESLFNDLGNWTLPAGDYTLTVSRSGDDVGGYDFRILDLDAGVPLVVGVPAEIPLESNHFSVLTFNATAGETFVLQTSVTGDLWGSHCYVVTPSGSAALREDGYVLFDRGRFTAPATGTYALLVLGTPVFGSYSGEFHCLLSPVNDPTPTPLNLGETVAVNMANLGESSLYSFTLNSSSLLCLESYIPNSYDQAPSAVVILPNGDEILISEINNHSTWQATPRYAFPAGEYTLRFNGPASFTFRLVDLSAAPVIEPGTSTTADFGNTHENFADSFQVELSAGETIALDLHLTPDPRFYLPGYYRPAVTIIDENNNIVYYDEATYGYSPSPSQSLLFGAPRSGTYTILFAHRYDALPECRPLTFELTRVEAQAAIIPLSLDTDVTAILAPHQSVIYSFSLSAPTKIYFDTLAGSGLLDREFWAVSDSTHRTFSGYANSDEVWLYVDGNSTTFLTTPVLSLPAGDYTLTLGSNYRPQVGNWQFRMRTVANAETLETGTMHTGHLDVPGPAGFFKFSAIAGNRFSFDSTWLTGDSYNAYWMVVDPYGNPVPSGQGSIGNSSTFTIQNDGTYVLLISEPQDWLLGGDFQFQLTPLSDVTIPPFSGTPIDLNSTVTGSLDTYYEQDDYTFSLESESTIYIDGQTQDWSYQWSLTGPSGTFNNGFVRDTYSDGSILTLPAGSYQFTASALGGVGPYQFVIRTLDSATPITPGTPVTSILDPGTKTDLYQFTATAGESFYFDFLSMTGTPDYTRWRVIDPFGNKSPFLIGDGYYGTPRDIGRYTIPSTGTYTILVEGGASSGPLEYSFNVIPIAPEVSHPLTSEPATAGLSVQNVNDAPVLDNTGVMSLLAIDEDALTNAGTTITGLIASAGGNRITDVDGDPRGIAISFAPASGGTWQYTLDGGTSWLPIGTVSINAALLLPDTPLSRIRFVPQANFNGSRSIQFYAWDQTAGTAGTKVDVTVRGGITPFSNSIESVSITINSVNDAPVIQTAGNPVLHSIPEDAFSNSGTSVSDLIASVASLDYVKDVDAGAAEGLAIYSAANSGGTWQFTMDNGLTWGNIGSVSATNARLLAADGNNTRIRFVPLTNFNGSRKIYFRAWDQTSGSNGGTADITLNGGTSAFSSNADSATITVTPVNDAPLLFNAKTPTLGTMNRSAVNHPGIRIADLISSAGAGYITDQYDASPLQGIAIYQTQEIKGYWQFSLNGTTWTNVGSVNDAAALHLAADANTRIRFVPTDLSATGDRKIFFRAWDRTNGITNGAKADSTVRGGTTAYSVGADSAILTVNTVNDAPVLNSAGTPVFPTIAHNELNPAGLSIPDLLTSGGANYVTDLDSTDPRGIAIYGAPNSGGTWEYSLDSGTNWTPVGIVDQSHSLLLKALATTRIRFRPLATFTGTRQISFAAWDQATGAEGTKVDTNTRGGNTAFSVNRDTAAIVVT